MRLYPVVLIICLSVLGLPAYAQDSLTAQTNGALNVREAPSPEATLITTLDPGTTLLVQGRSEDGGWLHVSSEDGSVQGWIAIGFVTLSRPVRIMQDLPVFTTDAAPPESEPAEIDSQTNPPAIPSDAITGEISSRLNVRQRPSTDGTVILTLDAGTLVQVEGRNDPGDWLLIRSADGAVRGWVAIGFVRLSRPVGIIHELAIRDPNALESNAEPGTESAPPLPGEVVGGDGIVMGSAVLNTVRTIYERGQLGGANPNMLMMVGDSNLDIRTVLCNFQHGHYDLGPYGHFQALIDDFNQSRAFCHDNLTTGRGFTTFNIIDPAWAPDHLCGANETPLECEVRLNRPAYALIYIGAIDLELMREDPEIVTYEVYRTNLTTIASRLSELGVVPILSTFPTADYFNPGASTVANMVVREVAAALQVPLIDLRAVTYDHENHGAAGDGFHMRTSLTGKTDFNGHQSLYARTQYEFLVLEILSRIRGALGAG